ncbi:hypothetical protein PVAND_013294 [Polypedilum vanderplanki]|uniref:Uncharacterized protein n=1 Tax=Polypedilum vanderplanki TaxID=319348 RepID=A0A9J6CP86_POLVA|nr:hypothetical protein PVAND_013294 [Polypedilum vanderplanki]
MTLSLPPPNSLGISFELPIGNDVIKNELEKYLPEYLNNLSSWNFTNCESFSDASRLFIQENLVTELQRHSNIVHLIIKLNEKITLENFEVPKYDNFKGIKEILITYESNNDENQTILCWKNEKFQHFQWIYLNDDYSKSISPFVEKFLKEELTSIKVDHFASTLKNEVYLPNISNGQGFNLLMKAVEENNIEICQYLLKHPFDINQKSIKEETAADIAWKNKNLEILLMLLKDNSIFPKLFDRDQADEPINEFLNICVGMHDAIKENDVEAIQTILAENRNLRHFYNSNNVSAAAFAIDEKQIGLYRVLTKRNVTFGPIEDYNKYFDFLEKHEKKHIKEIHDENSQELLEKHITFLILNSIISHDDKTVDVRQDIVKEAFKTLNEIPQMKLIMQVVATSKKLKITFDFYRDSVEFMDPVTGNPSISGIFYLKGNIYIAARNLLQASTRLRVIAVLAHELCHYAMYLVYGNDAKPYAIDDDTMAKRFQTILETCEGKQTEEEIINLLFCYSKSDQHAELIVRVPHMLTYYHENQNELIKLRDTFNSLFGYFDNTVMQDMEESLPVLKKLSYDVSDINFEELTVPLKQKIYHSFVNFQGQEIEFSEILTSIYSKVLRCLKTEHIHNLMKGTVIDIHQKDFNLPKIYMKRNICKKFMDHIVNEQMNVKDFLSNVENERIVLILGEADEGKTTFIKNANKELKEIKPNYWISYIDLKKHLNVYEKYENSFISIQNILTILNEILELDSKLEIEIFNELYKQEKVILMFDGFDEIAPIFNKIFLKLVNFIALNSKNQQWISSRIHHKIELQKQLLVDNKYYYRMPKLDKNSKNQLVMIILESYAHIKEKQLMMKEIQTLLELLGKSEEITSPQLIVMITDLCCKDKKFTSKFNIHELYSEIFSKKKDFLEQKGPVANKDRDNEKSTMTIWQIHQLYALKNNIGNTFKELDGKKTFFLNTLELFKKWKEQQGDWSPEAVSRYGFMFVNDWKIEQGTSVFVHKTYQDYFIAQFIIESICLSHTLSSNENEIEVKMELLLLYISNVYYDNCNDWLPWLFIESYLRNIFNRLKTVKFNPEIIKFFKKREKMNMNVKKFIKMFEFFSQDKEITDLVISRYEGKNVFKFVITSPKNDELHRILNFIKLYEEKYGPDWYKQTGYTFSEEYVSSLVKPKEIDFCKMLKFESTDDFKHSKNMCQTFYKFLKFLKYSKMSKIEFVSFLKLHLYEMINFAMRSMVVCKEFFDLLNFYYTHEPDEECYSILKENLKLTEFYINDKSYEWIDETYLKRFEYFWPLPPLPPLAQPTGTMLNQQKSSTTNIHQSSNVMVTTTTQTAPISTIKTITSTSTTTTPTGVVKPTPSIAVTHSQSIEREEAALLNLTTTHVRSLSPSKRKELKKFMQQKNKHSAFDKYQRSNESLDSNVKTSTESILNRNEASEGSTTEDYMTCTDNSKRTHTHPAQGTTQNSQAITIDGSSFESASSFHSLARIDAICEDTAVDEKPKSSPAHSDSSTSSGSYRMPPQLKASSPSRTTLPKPAHVIIKKNKKESVSDDERSDKFQSSSHDERDHKALRMRKPKEWNEEERRRKKGNFKLEIDKESKMPLSSSFARTSTSVLKKMSPDDKSSLNVLDGTSPSKQKTRFRPKTRKTPRNRTPIGTGDESTSVRRLSKTSLNKSPEKPSVIAAPMPQQPQVASIQPAKVSPLKFTKPCHLASPTKHQKKSSSAIQRLKAISTESLRSVSPGSDSVFYNSEADLLEHQIHCHHCGKEVEVVTAVGGGSEESVVIVDDGPDIVQPPEGFADSPNGISKIPPALKYYKRFRSEDRRHKKGSNGRAKSEERGSEDVTNGKIRGSGSSPCVVPSPFGHDHHHELEQGIYHGSYSHGTWICIADKDFWRKNEIPVDAKYAESGGSERRASTESEKEFRKKYQAITHRLVHRKSCVEMYRRQSSNSFDTDKRVIVQRLSGEFGFRIHGSKPVVVSAIEKDTPAETSGLEVGDIVLSVNGISVVDKSHSEVVKIAHAGSDTLELEVARTMNAFSPVSEPSPSTTSEGTETLHSGFLWRKSDSCKWIRRWFCLRTDQCLYFYKNETDIQPLGIILLTNHIVSQVPFEKSNRPFSFTIETSESRVHMLSADSQDTLNGWISVLSRAAEQNDPWLEMNSRNLKLPPSSITRPDCAGYLMKLGIRWRSWTKRYCVLKDACLYFYNDSNSKSAIGMVLLQGYRVQPFAMGGKKYAFELIPAEPKYRSYYFHTETEMDKKRWVAALEYSIDRWMKAN